MQHPSNEWIEQNNCMLKKLLEMIVAKYFNEMSLFNDERENIMLCEKITSRFSIAITV